MDATPLHLVSAFAAGAGLVLGQQATAEKSNEKTAIPQLLATLALEGCIVTIDAMGTQANIAQAIRERGANYLLSAKDNQPMRTVRAPVASRRKQRAVAASIAPGYAGYGTKAVQFPPAERTSAPMQGVALAPAMFRTAFAADASWP